MAETVIVATPQSATPKPSAQNSISWVVERDALCKFGDRRTRAVLAILMARRSARKSAFFVPPQIADRFGLTPRDLCWALKDLDGKLLETLGSKKGKFRRVRLLPEWEERAKAEHETKAPALGTGGKDAARRQRARQPSHFVPPALDFAVQHTLEQIAREQSASRLQK